MVGISNCNSVGFRSVLFLSSGFPLVTAWVVVDRIDDARTVGTHGTAGGCGTRAPVGGLHAAKIAILHC